MVTGWRVGALLGRVHSCDTVGEFEARKILDRLGVNFESQKRITVLASLLAKRGIPVPDNRLVLRFQLDFYVTSLLNPRMRKPGDPAKFWSVEVQGDSHESERARERDELRVKALEAVGIKTIPIPSGELMSVRGRDLWTGRLAQEFGLEAPP